MSNTGVDVMQRNYERYVKEKSNYFIETSEGKVYFRSDNLEGLIVTSNNSDIDINSHRECNFKHIFIEPDMIDKIIRLYTFDEMMTQSTKDGWFLRIRLSDPYYGTPEYKIHPIINEI